MKCIYNPSVVRQRKVIGVNNNPELRQQLILAALRKLDVEIIENDKPIEMYELEKVHGRCYINFLRYAYDDAVKHQDQDWLSNDQLIPTHFGRTKTDRLPWYKLAGIYGSDTISPIIDTTYESASKSAMNGYLAAQLLHKSSRREVIYCLNSSPGHHAKTAGYAGYCFINNGAIVASTLGEKVAILDLDYHHGDGTQEIFYESDKVLTVSLHADPVIDYPSFSGFVDEDGYGYNLNIPLAKGTTWSTYKLALMKAITAIQEFEPLYLVIAFGSDTYELDPDFSACGGFKIKIEDYISMGRLIKQHLGYLSTVVTAEGGYNLDATPQIVCNFLTSLV